MAAIQSIFQIFFDNQTSPRAVDNTYTLLHLSKGSRINHFIGFVSFRNMDGNKICTNQQIIKFNLFNPQFTRTISRQKRVISDDIHTQPQSTVSNNRTDIATPDHTQNLGIEFNSHKPALFPFTVMGRSIGLWDLTCQGHHHR